MEVHHPQTLRHKKKWTGYFLEFLMLFLAVFLGFIAENIREEIHNKKLERAYLKAIVKDLEADSVKASLVIHYTETGEKGVRGLSHYLYKYHSGKMNEDNFLKGILGYVDSVYDYWTLYINNASYKNMVSSGRLNNLHNADLRDKMSVYYESLSKQIDANNAIVDQMCLDYYNNYFPFAAIEINRDIQHGTLSINSDEDNHRIKPTQIQDSAYMNPNAFLGFMVSLPLIKSRLLSDELMLRTEILYNRIVGYHALCLDFMDANNKLLGAIRGYSKK